MPGWRSLTPALWLVRLGGGMMMGVDHNKNQKWVGASAAFFPAGGLVTIESWEQWRCSDPCKSIDVNILRVHEKPITPADPDLSIGTVDSRLPSRKLWCRVANWESSLECSMGH